jgi:dihydrofolate synthase/folylpolyglutamate synthase
LEWFGETRQVLLDVSHNPAGTTCLAAYLDAQEVPRIHLVVGLSGERNPTEVLMPLAKIATAVYAVPVSCRQSVSSARITDWAEAQGVPVSEYATASEGLSAALDCSGSKAPVVVCGSLYLVAELRQELLEGGSRST